MDDNGEVYNIEDEDLETFKGKSMPRESIYKPSSVSRFTNKDQEETKQEQLPVIIEEESKLINDPIQEKESDLTPEESQMHSELSRLV